MALQFRICRACGESHALRSDGRMSIHSTADGARCEEPRSRDDDARAAAAAAAAAARAAAAAAAARDRARRDRDRALRSEEMETAFEFAANRKAKRPDPGSRSSFDRRIYAVDGVHTVRGGLPTIRKR